VPSTLDETLITLGRAASGNDSATNGDPRDATTPADLP